MIMVVMVFLHGKILQEKDSLPYDLGIWDAVVKQTLKRKV
jgi:hypothetical protein